MSGPRKARSTRVASSSIAEVCLIEDYEGYVHYAVGLSTTKAPKLKVQRTGGIIRVLMTSNYSADSDLVTA